MTTGERIDQLAKSKGISLHKLATLAGVSYNTVYSAVKRKSDRVDRKIIEKIAKALDVDIKSIISEEQFLTDYTEETLSQFPHFDAVDALIHKYSRTLNHEGRMKLLNYAHELIMNSEYRKNDDELSKEYSKWHTSRK